VPVCELEVAEGVGLVEPDWSLVPPPPDPQATPAAAISATPAVTATERVHTGRRREMFLGLRILFLSPG